MSAPEWIASLGDRDPSVPIALAAITRAAGAADTVDFGDLVMSYREAHIAMEILADARQIIALDLVEVNPVLDHQNMTADLAAELAASALGLRIL